MSKISDDTRLCNCLDLFLLLDAQTVHGRLLYKNPNRADT